MEKRISQICCFLLFFHADTISQSRHEAILDTVTVTDFHHIAITPALGSLLKTDLSDLRIIDEKGRPVPYTIESKTEAPGRKQIEFHLPIISRRNTATTTELLIHNEEGKRLDHFLIGLKNAVARRSVSLSASDDQQHWFVVVDSTGFVPPAGNEAMVQTWDFHFQPVNYRYFRMVIFNERNQALNILNVRSSMDTAKDGSTAFVTNPRYTFSQREDGRISKINLYGDGDTAYQFNRIHFGIEGARHYRRNVRYYTGVGKPGEETPQQYAGSFTLDSDEKFGYDIPIIKSPLLFLEIDNGDNPPLRISSISTTQSYRSVIAYLEKGKRYRLLLNDPQARAPIYDLEEFKDRIKPGVPLEYTSILALDVPSEAGEPESAFKRWIWPVLAILILLLGLLAWKLTRDMRNESNKQ